MEDWGTCRREVESEGTEEEEGSGRRGEQQVR